MRPLPFVIAAAFAAGAVVGQDAAPEPLAGRIRAVRIDALDIFDPEMRARRPLADLVDSLHATTKREVIARELWFAPGDRVDAETAAELERNLRALGLFAEVTVRLVPAPSPGEVDVEVVTRDRLSLQVGGGGSYVGGVSGFRASLGEGNLFGLGDRIVGSFSRNSDGDYRGAVAYTDLHVLDSWHTGTVRYASTDEGDSYGLEVRRPFKHLADPRAWATSLGHEESEMEYYRAGDSVAAVRDVSTSFGGELLWADGPTHRRRTAGIEVAAVTHDLDPATGPLAPAIRVPGDTTSVFVGPTLRYQWIDGYRKVEGLDTLAYVQDLTLGSTIGATVGARWRIEEGGADAVEPEAAIAASFATELVENMFVNTAARGAIRWNGDDAAGWDASVSGRAFAMWARGATLGAAAAFDAVEEHEDLPIELTLGEDNGLRGYTARAFAGTRRLRTNVEQRFDTGIEFATLRLGLVVFWDTGRVGRGGELGRPFDSAGVGLRIGSRQLLGDGIVRIDSSKPLDDTPDGDDGWQLSISVGQVFTFGGYTNTLSVR
ncbi:MAG: hypothetical protein JNK78_20660 [Planctomycetes bacterium]|nr:hypothetical protein [Planctomycetota bacterium]